MASKRPVNDTYYQEFSKEAKNWFDVEETTDKKGRTRHIWRFKESVLKDIANGKKAEDQLNEEAFSHGRVPRISARRAEVVERTTRAKDYIVVYPVEVRTANKSVPAGYVSVGVEFGQHESFEGYGKHGRRKYAVDGMKVKVYNPEDGSVYMDEVVGVELYTRPIAKGEIKYVKMSKVREGLAQYVGLPFAYGKVLANTQWKAFAEKGLLDNPTVKEKVVNFIKEYYTAGDNVNEKDPKERAAKKRAAKLEVEKAFREWVDAYIRDNIGHKEKGEKNPEEYKWKEEAMEAEAKNQ